MADAALATGRPAEILPLTGLRGVLAWWVVLFHFGRETVPTVVAARIATSGHTAVDVFFVLSGYVLARRYADVDFRQRQARRSFWVRRFARVYPLYLASLALGFAASSPRSFAELMTGKGQLCAALQLALLNAWSHRAMFAHNWAAWSLSVEALFYAMAPWLFTRMTRLSRRALVGLIVLSWAATFVAPALYTAVDPDHLGRPLALGDEVLWGWYLKFFPLQRVPEFVAGAAAAIYVRGATRPSRPLLAVASTVTFLGLATAGVVPFAYLHSGVLLPLVVALILALDHDDPSWLASRWAVASGHASYATYVLHVPFFLLAARFEPALWQGGAGVIVYAAALAVVVVAARIGLEEPCRRGITRRLTTPTAVTPSRA